MGPWVSQASALLFFLMFILVMANSQMTASMLARDLTTLLTLNSQPADSTTVQPRHGQNCIPHTKRGIEGQLLRNGTYQSWGPHTNIHQVHLRPVPSPISSAMWKEASWASRLCGVESQNTDELTNCLGRGLTVMGSNTTCTDWLGLWKFNAVKR